jgi:hypothetical protein
MSYSRWSHSTWYTFWSSVSESTEYKLSTKRLKNAQVFEICDFPSYYITYGELVNDGLYTILERVETYYRQSHTIFTDQTSCIKNPTKEEMDELGGYLLEFIKDVDNHFKWYNYFKYEWYYPTRNKIKNLITWQK